jgi:hypothetical protein
VDPDPDREFNLYKSHKKEVILSFEPSLLVFNNIPVPVVSYRYLDKFCIQNELKDYENRLKCGIEEGLLESDPDLYFLESRG